MAVIEESEFYGVLGRIEQDAGSTALRFYPFAFRAETDARPVFVVTCTEAVFVMGDVAPYLGREMQVTVSDHLITLDDVFKGMLLEISAVKTSWDLCPYDMRDCLEHIRNFDSIESDLHKELIEERQRKTRATSVAQELLRRAEIKAQASDEQSRLQRAAIAVIQRMLVELG